MEKNVKWHETKEIKSINKFFGLSYSKRGSWGTHIYKKRKEKEKEKHCLRLQRNNIETSGQKEVQVRVHPVVKSQKKKDGKNLIC